MLSLFLLIDVILLILFVVFLVINFRGNKEKKQQKIRFSYLNEKYHEFVYDISKDIAEKESKLLGKKIVIKDEQGKRQSKKSKRTYVLTFKGGVFAEEVEKLRKEITAILAVARPDQDEVVVKLDSPGGTVSGYGLASSQLQRIRDKKIKLTVLIDQVAASGGYMMAVVSDTILAAPFSYIGSVGVVSEFPNFSKLMEKFGVEWKTYTAGSSKRDVGSYGKITADAERRHKKKLADIHILFKSHIKANRPVVNVDKIATGEVWTASEALKLKMVDGIKVSDEYIMEQIQGSNVYNVYTPETRSKLDRILESFFNIPIKKVKAFWVETQGEKFL